MDPTKTSRTLKHRVIRRIDVHFDPASDDEDYFQSADKDNIQLIKDNVKKIVDYSANSTEYYPASRLVIAPHYLKNVPSEIVSLIMKYLVKQQSPHLSQKELYQCALVSTQFYRIANPMLWHTLTIPNANVLAQLTSSLASAQMSKAFHGFVGNLLQRLDIQGPYWNDVDFSFMLPFIRSLKTLTIGDNAKNITCASLKHLPQCCPHLSQLYLVHTPITDEFIDAIRQHRCQLRQIDLSTKDLPSNIFKKLDKCPLEAIGLHCHLPYVTSFGMRSGASIAYNRIVNDMTTVDQLTHLLVHGRATQFLTDIIFSMNDTVTWPRLARLQISGQDNITEDAFISFIKSHHHLAQLELPGQLSDSALHAIATHLPNLTHLLLHYSNMITKSGIYYLVQHCNGLQQADFLNCHHIANTMPEFFDAESNGVRLDAEKMKQIRQEGQQ